MGRLFPVPCGNERGCGLRSMYINTATIANKRGCIVALVLGADLGTSTPLFRIGQLLSPGRSVCNSEEGDTTVLKY
jgi:hypothetical protein